MSRSKRWTVAEKAYVGVPERVGLVKTLETLIPVAYMKESGLSGYRFLEACVTYGGVCQRWVVVHSEAAQERELAALEKRVQREAEKAERAKGCRA